VADLVILMKQVPFIHNRLTRDVATQSKLKKTAANTTAYTATLAAIAQATWYTPPQSAVGKPDRVKKWQEYCDQMREASGEVNAAIHQGDFGATGSAMQRLNRSCNACHGLFRK
jgi:cytochrome c556